MNSTPVLGTETIALVTLFLSFCGSLIVQLIKKITKINGNEALLTTIVTSLILGIGFVWFTGEGLNQSKVEIASVIFTISTLIYRYVIKNWNNPSEFPTDLKTE